MFPAAYPLYVFPFESSPGMAISYLSSGGLFRLWNLWSS